MSITNFLEKLKTMKKIQKKIINLNIILFKKKLINCNNKIKIITARYKSKVKLDSNQIH